MLIRALYLSAGWLVLSFIATVLRGLKVKTGNPLRSLLWLTVVLLSGDLWALLTFGVPWEVIGLTVITFVLGCFWIWRLKDWNALAQTLWVVTLLTTVLYIVYSFALSAFTPLHPLAFIAALGLSFIETLALLLALTFAFEALDVCCRVRWNRRFQPMSMPGYTPKVSLHVPAYNEPPEVVEATLRSLAELNYPNFEVLVIDNNTPGEEVWRPLEKICRELGLHFRFLHLDKWPGYKSGALNFALTQTAPDAEVIGIIDADYLVSPHFLSDMVPFFADRAVAFVQTPQNYRDYQGNPFLEICQLAYKYFFAVSMPSRNEHNAIIFAGTMGLIRRSVLEEIGGWDEWCITEDAEASLRVLKRGYQSVYVNRAYGTGLMPYTFDGLKKQRFRWCFGGIQILKKHWQSLLPWSRWVDPDNRLTFAQRYFYLFGGLQWFTEPLNLIFTIFLIAGALIQFSPTGGMLRPLTGPLIVMPGIFLLIGLWRFLWVLRASLHLNIKDAFKAMTNFFSLGWTVTLACIQGLIRRGGVFMRTPKSRSNSDFIRGLQATQWETAIGSTCILCSIGAILYRPHPTSIFLAGMLAWQSVLYLSAPYYSLLSLRGPQVEPREEVPVRAPYVRENWLARWAIGIAFLLLIGLGVVLLLPAPNQAPSYAHLPPQDIPVQQLVGLPTPEPPTATIPVLVITLQASPSVIPLSTTTATGVTITASPSQSPTATNTVTTPSPSPTGKTPTATPTVTATTPTATVTHTMTATQTVTATDTITATLRPSPTATASTTATRIPTKTATNTPSPLPTWTPTLTATSTDTLVPAAVVPAPAIGTAPVTGLATGAATGPAVVPVTP